MRFPVYLSLFCTLFLHASVNAVQVRFTGGEFAGRLEDRRFELGQNAFNSSPELVPMALYLKNKYNIDTVIETGTYKGNTTVLFSSIFDHVYTIEVSDTYYKEVSTKLAQYKNIKCIMGSSQTVLKRILPGLKEKRILFFLDAHWQSFWPLRHEIATIAKTHRDNSVIIIDDIKVPGREEIPFDKYGDNECSLEYVKKELDKAYSSYSYYYLIPENYDNKAKLVVIPNGMK